MHDRKRTWLFICDVWKVQKFQIKNLKYFYSWIIRETTSLGSKTRMSEPKVLQYDFILRRQRSLTLVNTQDDILLMALGSSSRIYRLFTSLALPILLHIHNSIVKEEILDSLSSKWPDSLVVQLWLEVLDYCFPENLFPFLQPWGFPRNFPHMSIVWHDLL